MVGCPPAENSAESHLDHSEVQMHYNSVVLKAYEKTF